MKVSAFRMACMAISMLVCFLLPVALAVVYKRRGARLTPLFVGVGVFILFALVLEQWIHGVVLSGPLGGVIQGNLPLYALYGGLMAGVFEETGRFLAFHVLLRDATREDALMYGAGHGGIEAILLAGMTMVNNLILSSMINAGTLTEGFGGLTQEQLDGVVGQMTTIPATDFLMGGLERVLAVALHVALSVLVYAAVCRGMRWCFPAAIALHAGADALMLLVSPVLPTLGIELVVLVCVVLVVLLARRVWGQFSEEKPLFS